MKGTINMGKTIYTYEAVTYDMHGGHHTAHVYAHDLDEAITITRWFANHYVHSIIYGCFIDSVTRIKSTENAEYRKLMYARLLKTTKGE